jgi:nicotinamide-nucleotide amidase
MSARAGIVVTGTEVLDARVVDRNGPWLSERLSEVGVDVAYITVVGDRPSDMLAALRFQSQAGVDVIVTSGGLGPTEDDRTAEVVGEFQGRAMELDSELEERIALILEPLIRRWPGLDPEALRLANRKQAVVPHGATVLEPVGTAPGLIVAPLEGVTGPTVVVLPGPPRELRPMWYTAIEADAFRRAAAGAIAYRRTMLRLFGIPESEIAETMRAAREAGVDLDALEITTCLRRGEVEVVTRYEPGQEALYARWEGVVRERHAGTLFSDDGSSVDDQVARLLLGENPRRFSAATAGAGAVTAGAVTIAVAESCTGGLLAGRLTERPGSSAYMLGGVVVYSDDAKVALAGVAPELIAEFGAVSTEVAAALADGARAAVGASVGVGVTGVAGPGGGTEEKPVGLVCFSVSWGGVGSGGGSVLGSEGSEGEVRRLTRRITLPGSRADIRDRATTVALHLVRRLLLGEDDALADEGEQVDAGGLLQRP